MANSSGHLEGLGETLIPAINRLQDIFSQVAKTCKLYHAAFCIVRQLDKAMRAAAGLSDSIAADFQPYGSGHMSGRHYM